MLKRFPLDLSTFSELRVSHYVYVDKTQYAYDIITRGRRYFLSRPRRFGKSLFVSTLREILQGNRDLFEGLWIEKSDYVWQKYGIIEFDLSALGIDSVQTLKAGLCHVLGEIVQDYGLGIEISSANSELALRDVVKSLKAKFGRVAILIDEYDNPILHTLKDMRRSEDIRDGLRSFFAAIKGMDSSVDFVFITGVSSFARAGLFSGINNLRDITLDAQYATICGYTEHEIDFYFSDHIKKWSEQLGMSRLYRHLNEP